MHAVDSVAEGAARYAAWIITIVVELGGDNPYVGYEVE